MNTWNEGITLNVNEHYLNTVKVKDYDLREVLNISDNHWEQMQELTNESEVGKMCVDLIDKCTVVARMTKDTQVIQWYDVYRQMMVYMFA